CAAVAPATRPAMPPPTTTRLNRSGVGFPNMGHHLRPALRSVGPVCDSGSSAARSMLVPRRAATVEATRSALGGPMMQPTKFGIFLAPFHNDDENPTLQLRSDLDLITHLDRLGYDEAWVGEHHSGSYEIIGSPEVFIAA